jgi:hypothetical protein
LPHIERSRYSNLPARMPFTRKARSTPCSFFAVTSLRVAPLRFHSMRFLDWETVEHWHTLS